ncbi:restriction endonuclease subunit S [Actinomadura algeriensis]|uniref:Type I restriction enzyme S subunit n=1 Tax=Actinomadura algeriensis TaxID=1679523 RepID=A0ABR9JJK0_9ACTN|nr:restriction endonuclease subunit S [Actinomadura algeriensis]MBE1530566.1 type I restriction enzyme S subunit [Actinomadura algeriensis]
MADTDRPGDSVRPGDSDRLGDTVRLGDLVDLANGRARPSPGLAYRTYGSNGVIGTSDRFNADAGTVIVGRVGTYCGAVHYSPDRCWVTDNAIIVTPKDGVRPRYVHYLLKALDLNRYRMGSGQPLLTQGVLNGLRVPRASRARQDEIAGTLGALDDKIAVNGRLAALTDELVRARYDEAAATARASVRIDALGTLRRDLVPASRITGAEAYIALEHVPRRHMWLTTWTNAADVRSGKARFAAGDVLFGKLRPYFHKVGLAFVDGVASTDILVVRPGEEAHRGWLLAALAGDDVVAHASAVSDGTRMPRAAWPDLARHEIPWPGDAAARRFGEAVEPLARRVAAAAAESKALAALRDALLPDVLLPDVPLPGRRATPDPGAAAARPPTGTGGPPAPR